MNDKQAIIPFPSVSANTIEAYTQNLNTKVAFCAHLVKSGLVPTSFKAPEAVLAVILKGQELGFAPMQSLESFDFIQGRVTIRAAAMAALIQSHGDKIEVIEETAAKCTLRGTRKDNGWTQEYSFTIEDAGAMGLAGKDNWKKMPKFMLYARCLSVLARRGWADLLGGLHSTEELQDSTEVDMPQTSPIPPRKPRQPVIDVTPEAAPTNGHSFYYSTMTVPEEKREAAKEYLGQCGAFYDEDLKVWQSPSRIAKMDKYQVEVKKEAGHEQN